MLIVCCNDWFLKCVFALLLILHVQAVSPGSKLLASVADALEPSFEVGWWLQGLVVLCTYQL
jgi:hypothetical protein